VYVTYPDIAKFTVLWMSMDTHCPYSRWGVYLDEPMRDALADMKQKGYLDDTVVILMGDHGDR
jgi:phosphoglycerol transferase MdoB-like AlkP superfamily enzyme